MRITVTLKDVIFVLVMIIVIFGLYRIFKDKEPITNETFAQLLSTAGYETLDMGDVSGDWWLFLQEYYNDKNPKILNYDIGLDVVDSYYIAKKSSSESEIAYKIYKSDEEAERSFARYKDSRKFKTSNLEVEKYYRAGHHEKNRTGKNYEMFYTEDIESDFFLVSRINNTLLIAFVEGAESENLNKVFNKSGYGIYSY